MEKKNDLGKDKVFWIILHFIFYSLQKMDIPITINSIMSSMYFKSNLLILVVSQHSDYAVNYFLKWYTIFLFKKYVLNEMWNPGLDSEMVKEKQLY